MIWFFLVPYLFILSICSRMLAGHFAWHMYYVDQRKWSHDRDRIGPTGEQWFGAILGAFIVSLLWPIAILFFLWPITFGAEKYAIHDKKIKERDEIINKYEKQLR